MFHLISSIYTDLTQRPRFNVLCVGHGDSGKTTLLQVLKSQLASPDGGKVKAVSGAPSSLPKTRPTVGQNVFDLQCPPPSPRPLIIPAYPPPDIDPSLSASASSSSSSSWWTTSTSTNANANAKTKQPSKALLHIWDLGGEKGLRSIWREYFDEADCVVYFWDCGHAGRGEAREEAWQTLASLARDAQLSHLPFLVLLSRSDLTTGTEDKGKARATDEDDDANLSKTSTEDDDEEGDLSLTIERPAGDSYESETTQPSGNMPTSPSPSTPLSPPQLRQSATPAMMENTDVLESLRMFIVSHIEALSVDTEGADDEEDAQRTDNSEGTTPFPETTIIPVSSLTGRGIVECVDWLVYKSLDSTRRA